ncbi:hypothetical protein C0216_06930 [Streptomyces globosus]|uniref:DUF4190 domain-containing protein n=1 Tax=Streptomyces globosus TaxID=68209 RepID=A0A344TX51_9ACTN|nr:hypothetical protein C0216_06930 [Streptomyces globosus]
MPGPPSVHDQPTLAGMPGAGVPPAPPAPLPGPYASPAPGPAPVPPAYAYPAPPASGMPGVPGAPGYAYPGPASVPAPPAYAQQPYGPQPFAPQAYPGAGPLGHPLYGAQPRNGFGVAALVLGIVAVVGCALNFIAVGLGVAAIVFGVLGRSRAARGEATNGGMALAGLILGVTGALLGALMLAFAVAGFLQGESGSGTDSPYSDTRMREKV